MEVVVFPWLAFGHMLPFLELSKRLAARGHAIAFVSTPRNLARLPPVPPHLSARLRFVSMPLPRVDGLPDGAESTADVPLEKIEFIKKAMDGLAAPFAAFLAGGTKHDWIIHDFCHHWVPPIADEHNVPCAAFLIVHVAFVAFLGPRWANSEYPRAATEDFAVAPGWMASQSTVAYRRRSEAEWIAGMFRANASGVSDIERVWGMFERSRLTIYRSCDEVDPGMFALLTDLLRKPAVPAGVLLPPVVAAHDKDEVLLWLDEQPPRSVIYVALGSEAPLVMLPFVVDQPLVARAMEEKGIGVEVVRDDTDSSFDRDAVAAAVRRVMVDDEGKVLASNARKLQEILADQMVQERYIR